MTKTAARPDTLARLLHNEQLVLRHVSPGALVLRDGWPARSSGGWIAGDALRQPSRDDFVDASRCVAPRVASAPDRAAPGGRLILDFRDPAAPSPGSSPPMTSGCGRPQARHGA